MVLINLFNYFSFYFHSLLFKNYIIYKFLLNTLIKDKDDSLSFMVKSRDLADTVEIEDLNIRARLSTEKDLTKIIKTKKPKILA